MSSDPEAPRRYGASYWLAQLGRSADVLGSDGEEGQRAQGTGNQAEDEPKKEDGPEGMAGKGHQAKDNENEVQDMQNPAQMEEGMTEKGHQATSEET